jgi:hypothetical protein
MTEETRDASTAGPRGIVTSIVVSLFAGWLLLVVVMFAQLGGVHHGAVHAADLLADHLG